MELRVVDRLDAHAADWDRIVDRMPLPSPFLRSWWLMHTAVGRPQFALVFDRGRLAGGLALQSERRAGIEWLTHLGSGPLEPDHLDLVSSPGEVELVAGELHRWLGRPGSRVVDLVGLRSGAWVLDAVPGWGRAAALEVAPFVELPSDPERYLASRGGRMRSTINRTHKRLARDGVVERAIDGSCGEADVERALEALHELHDGRWGDASGFLANWEQFAAATRAGVAAGECRFQLLEATSTEESPAQIIAIEVDFVVGGRTSFYQAGRLTDHRWRGSGSVLRFAAISAAVASGCTEFDLLRGGEDYKAEWADRRRGLIRLRRGVGPAGVAVVAAATANATVQTWRTERANRASPPETGSSGPVPGRVGAGSESRTRLVFYTDAAQIGGAESVAKTLLAELADRFDVIVVGTSQLVVDDIVAVRPQSSTMVLAPIADKTDLAAIHAHRRALAALRPDIFHASLSEGSSCQYALLAALSIPGLAVVAGENSPMGVRTELSRRIKQRSARRFDAHIGVGRRAAELVEQDLGLAPGSVRVIPNGVPIIEHPEPVRHHPGPSVVAVSRFDPVKGLDVLVRAVALIDPQQVPNLLVSIYGDGAERPAIEQLIDELGIGDRIELLGWHGDVRRQLVNFDVFVLPSRLEGLPMSLIEAMHAGIAVVATDVGSVDEVIEDGVTGRIVAPEDPAAIAAALVELFADDGARGAMAAAGQAAAVERFASSANVAAYEAVYDEVVASKRSTRGGRRR